MTTAHDTSNPNLRDLVKAKNPDGSQAKIVEALLKQSPVLNYVTFIEGNLDTGHRVTTETSIPSIGYRSFNEGVETSKFTTGQFDETCGMMEGHSQLDVELAALHANDAGYRAQRDMRFMRAFNYEFETGFFYNSTAASPKKWNGLAPRYNQLAGGANPYANQCIDSSVAGGTGNDQTSVWLVCFSPDTVFGITPKGSTSGITHRDMGVQMVTDAANNRFAAYETIWNWKVGLVVADGEAVVRIANVDTGSIVKTGQLLIDDMTTAFFRLRNPKAGRCVWFVNRLVNEYLFNQARGMVSSSTLSIKDDIETGTPLVHFMGIPIAVSDHILNTEAPIA